MSIIDESLEFGEIDLVGVGAGSETGAAAEVTVNATAVTGPLYINMARTVPMVEASGTPILSLIIKAAPASGDPLTELLRVRLGRANTLDAKLVPPMIAVLPPDVATIKDASGFCYLKAFILSAGGAITTGKMECWLGAYPDAHHPLK